MESRGLKKKKRKRRRLSKKKKNKKKGGQVLPLLKKKRRKRRIELERPDDSSRRNTHSTPPLSQRSCLEFDDAEKRGDFFPVVQVPEIRGSFLPSSPRGKMEQLADEGEKVCFEKVVLQLGRFSGFAA